MGVTPLDDGPVLLRIPFGFHLAVDTLPSGCLATAPEFRFYLGCIRRFRLPARLGVSLSAHPGQRGITPAFGYSAPYPSASGTLTHPIWALPSTPYEAVRLAALVSHGRPPRGFSVRTWRAISPAHDCASRFPSRVCPCRRGVFDPAGSVCPSPSRGTPCCLLRVRSAWAPRLDFGAQYPACTFPCQRFVTPVAGCSA
jgi:hypothetical protein